MIEFHKVNPLILVRHKHFFYKFLKLLWYIHIDTFVWWKVNTARKVQLFFLNFFYHFLKWFSVIRFFSIKHFVKNDTEGPHVAFLGVVLHFDVFLWVLLLTLGILIFFLFFFGFILFGFCIKQSQDVGRHVPKGPDFRLGLKAITAGLASLI